MSRILTLFPPLLWPKATGAGVRGVRANAAVQKDSSHPRPTARTDGGGIGAGRRPARSAPKGAVSTARRVYRME
jgi:hypothetical protein